MKGLLGAFRPYDGRDAVAIDNIDSLFGEGLLETDARRRDRLVDLRSRVYAQGVKRGVDVALATIALAGFAVFFPLLALAIKLDSRGPVFYGQTRIGIDRRGRRSPCAACPERRRIVYPGRPFRMLKLRTMHIDAERDGPRWASEDDERVTRVGRLLRKFRLDEFPQFINVVRGEMSVIGPRPERLCFIRQLENDVPCYHDRLVVLPGITGLAQVINGYDTDVESVRRKVALDRQYIGNLNLKTDLRIIWMTIRVVFAGDGAR